MKKKNDVGKFFIYFSIAVMIIYLVSRFNKNKIAMGEEFENGFFEIDTWDKKTNEVIATLNPKIIEGTTNFIHRLEKEGIKARVYSGYRTFAKQSELYLVGRDGSGKKTVTNADAGRSYHNYGLAFDLVEIKGGKAIWENPNWERIAEIGKNVFGFEWGGDWKNFKDRPHFQKTFGKSTLDYLALVQSGIDERLV